MSLQISSSSNPRVKAAAKLRDRRGRNQQGRIVIDGLREIRRACEANASVVEAFFCDSLCAGADSREVLDLLERANAELVDVTADVLSKLAFGKRSEGIVAVALTPERSLENLNLSQNAIVAVLEAVEKPGNVGAVIRSADAAGIDAVLVADPASDLFNPNTIRASLGAVFTLPTAQGASNETAAWLRQNGFQILAARVDGAIDYAEVDYDGRVAIVLGSEAHGLSEQWRDKRDTAISLPMRGNVDSLNVSATAAILFYEAQRQRSLR